MFNSINKVIRFLILSDFFLNAGWAFLAPVFAIFVLEDIVKGDLEETAKVAGFVFFIYWTAKSLFQIPIGRYFDRIHGERDDFWWMIFGLFIAALVPFGFLLASLPWHIYILEILHALGMALVVPAWNAIFTRHIDQGQEAYEWAMNSTVFGIGVGIAGGAGGILVALFGFGAIFALVGILTLVSCFILLLIQKDILPTDHIRINPFHFPFFHR